MLSFKEFLQERVLSFGINKKPDEREKYRDQIHDILKKSYADIGKYSGIKDPEEESAAIHHDITNSKIKLTKRGDRITSVHLYADKHGRKAIATGTDGTREGKMDWHARTKEDVKHKRAWGEYSGATEHIARKLGVDVIPPHEAEKIIGKKFVKVDDDGEHYYRHLGSQDPEKDPPHKKIAMGYPKKS